MKSVIGEYRYSQCPVAAGASPEAAAAAAAALRGDGAVFLRGVVPSTTCSALCHHIDLCAKEALAELGPGLRRIDWKLGLDDEGEGAGALVRGALQYACGPGGVAAVLAGVPAASAAARLVELSVLCTEPGAPRQVLHPDMVYDADHAPLFTVFVALQDIAEEMGPTTFLLGSHQEARLQELRHLGAPGSGGGGGEERLGEARAVAPGLARGDAVLYDARVLHAGGANALRRRGLLTFSFLRPPVPAAPHRHNAGAAFSALPRVLARRLTAPDLAAGAELPPP